MNTILIPLDGSPLAEQALPPACRLARATGATLLLVQGVAFEGISRQQEAEERAVVTGAVQYLAATELRLRGEGFTVRSEVLPCGPAGAILFAAHVHHADLIAMSTHGRSGLRHVLLGSVAQEVLRHSECPVLIARTGVNIIADQQFRQRILVPLDGSPLSEAALAYLAGEHLVGEAEVILLRVVQPPSFSGIPILSAEAAAELFASADRQAQEERRVAEDYLTALGRAYLQDISWDTRVVVGDPLDEIVRRATALQANLIVMATADRHGFERLLYGSVAGRVIRHASMPVLLVHDVSKR